MCPSIKKKMFQVCDNPRTRARAPQYLASVEFIDHTWNRNGLFTDTVFTKFIFKYFRTRKSFRLLSIEIYYNCVGVFARMIIYQNICANVQKKLN